MIEILGNKLKQFFDIVDNPPNDAEITYAGEKYEVWEVSDELHKKMCDMSEEDFVEIAGEDAWWRSSTGSVLGAPDTEFDINGNDLVAWDSPIYESKKGNRYESLSDYLCNCVGVSQPKNVCACAMDLAKYNDMSMAELFEKYE